MPNELHVLILEPIQYDVDLEVCGGVDNKDIVKEWCSRPDTYSHTHSSELFVLNKIEETL